MTIDVNKTPFFDTGDRQGAEIFRKVVAEAPAEILGQSVASSLSFLMNQALNSMATRGAASPLTHVGLANLHGFVTALIETFADLAEGYRFEITTNPDGSQVLHIVSARPSATTKAAPKIPAAAGVTL